MTVGEKIEEILIWSGLNQKSLASKTGIARSTLSDYIRGVSSPTIEVAQAIADALGVSLWTLLNGEPLEITEKEITLTERRLLGDYRALVPMERELVDHMLQVLKNKRSVY